MSGIETDTRQHRFFESKGEEKMETDTHVSTDVLEKGGEAESLPQQAVSSGRGGHSLYLSHP